MPRPMTERESSREIEARAADWAARRDRGPLSDADARALADWLAGDPRRRGALLRADALALLSEKARALGVQGAPVVPVAPRRSSSTRAPSRRAVLAWTGAGAAAATSLALFGLGAAAAQTVTTGLGEVRRITLDDGSTILMNTRTSLRIRYDAHARQVDLLYGEAYFTVLREPRRPFLVAAGGLPLRTTQAAFRVRDLGRQPLDVLVDQGRVTLGQGAAVVMPAQTRTLFPTSGGATPVPQAIAPDRITRELAWRDGKIAFEGERLDQAAAQFARYSRTRIDIADPMLAREPITGLFAAGDPVGFGHAVAGIFGARLDRVGDTVRLSRPGRA